jgi:hypothetical protein
LDDRDKAQQDNRDRGEGFFHSMSFPSQGNPMQAKA